MKTSLIFMPLLLAACAQIQPAPVIPPPDPAIQQALNANIPTCSEARECEGMWSAARNWVSANCGMKIQTISDSFIQTFGSIDSSAACTVTKDPIPAGGYSFHAKVNCGTFCYPAPLDRLKGFQAELHAASSAFRSK